MVAEWVSFGLIIPFRDFLGGRLGYVHVKEMVKTAPTDLICSFEIV
jgi:hypothetical protein